MVLSGKQGAKRYVIELARAAGIKIGSRVLDLGCGLCGPARALVEYFDVEITALTNSRAHAVTSLALNDQSETFRNRIVVRRVEGSASWPAGPYGAAWSVNMMYQVVDHQELYGRILDVLEPGDLFILDDWMASDMITEIDLRNFAYHFAYRNLIRLSRVETELLAAGFYPIRQFLDRGDAARGPMTDHFETVMKNYFEPMLAEQWPDAPDSISGSQMATDFTEAVKVTLGLYRERKLTYRSIVAEKPS